MSEFVTGIPIGMAIGIAIGLAMGNKKKPWSELTEEEKKIRKKFLGLGIVIFLVGIIVFIWRLIYT